MKRIVVVLVCVTLLAGVLAACGGNAQSGQQPARADEAEARSTVNEERQAGADTEGQAVAGDGTVIETEYGSYTLPAGWSEMAAISTPAKPFYVKDGVPTDTVVSNISVECGDNLYSGEQHMEFRNAILQQLSMQAEAFGLELDSVTASGSFTRAGDVLYVFTLAESDVTTVQYYVVGENRHVLVHVTDFDDERIPDVNEVAEAIANSFVWA